MRGPAGWAALAAAALLAPAAPARAQELEPRSYSSSPVGLNFFIAAWAWSEGGLSTDPSVPLEDAHLRIQSVIVAYARTLDVGGLSGKFDVIVPGSDLSGSALVAGQPAERMITGLADPRFRFSINFLGAPARSMKEWVPGRKNLVAGTSLQITAPGGQYDPNRLVNLGSNRWAFKPDIGFSKPFGSFTVDFTAGATFYTDNDEYYGNTTLEQDPVYSAQGNLSYTFRGGAWIALGGTYYRGGKTRVGGAARDDELSNSRAGLTFAMPLGRKNSLKFNASTGTSTRTGTSFDTYGVGWQYRWGRGF